MALVLITPPAGDVVSLASAKAACRVEHDEDDAYIAGLVAAAVGWLDRALRPQTWELRLDAFPCGWDGRASGRTDVIDLPLPPLIGVTAVQYRDPSGALQTLAPASWRASGIGALGGGALRPAPGWSWPAAEPGPEAAIVRFEAGHPDVGGSTTVPAPIQQAVRLLAAHWYERREASTAETLAEAPFAVRALLAGYRTWRP